jgi:molybdopterin-guanine dinucleotide biosynthesis protein B
MDPDIPIKVPVVGLAAWSGTGKTSLLVNLIRLFRNRKLRIGIIKHAHHDFEIDYPGKDSYELRKAGAEQVLIGSRKRWALIFEREQQEPVNFEEYLRLIAHDAPDIILVEGFKPETIPKIELHRSELGRPFLFPDDNSIIAVATDYSRGLNTDLPVLDLNNPEQIAEFIIDRFLTEHKISSYQITNY